MVANVKTKRPAAIAPIMIVLRVIVNIIYGCDQDNRYAKYRVKTNRYRGIYHDYYITFHFMIEFIFHNLKYESCQLEEIFAEAGL
jgi:hypothetical protein